MHSFPFVQNWKPEREGKTHRIVERHKLGTEPPRAHEGDSDHDDLEKVAGVKHYTLLLPLKGVQSRAPLARQLHLALLDVSRDAQEQERGTR